MIQLLDRKVRQMHAAMDGLSDPDLSAINVEYGETEKGYYCCIDFGKAKTEIELANISTLLINNIACLKDHLKLWCKVNQKTFEGENLINADSNVAIIHDLWNIDKHGELDKRPPRSGCKPKLKDLRSALTLTSGAEAGSAVMMRLDPQTGKMEIFSSGGGAAELSVVGQIIDEHGNVLGDFSGICAKAVEAWENTLRSAGVSTPEH